MDDKVSLNKPPRVIKIQGWYQVIIIGVVAIMVSGANLLWTNQVDNRSERRRDAVERQADQRWCALLNFLVGIRSQAPDNELNRQYFQLLDGLRTELECEDKK